MPALLTLWCLGQTGTAYAQTGAPLLGVCYDPQTLFTLDLKPRHGPGIGSVREHSVVWHPARQRFYLLGDIVPLYGGHHPDSYDSDIGIWSATRLDMADSLEWSYRDLAVRRGSRGSYSGYGATTPAGAVFYEGKLFAAFAGLAAPDFTDRSIGLAWSRKDPEVTPWNQTAEPIAKPGVGDGNVGDPALLVPGDKGLHLYYRADLADQGYRIVHTYSRTPTVPSSWPKATPVPGTEPLRGVSQETTAVFALNGVVHLFVIEQSTHVNLSVAHFIAESPAGPFRQAFPQRCLRLPTAAVYGGHFTPILKDGQLRSVSWTEEIAGAPYHVVGNRASMCPVDESLPAPAGPDRNCSA